MLCLSGAACLGHWVHVWRAGLRVMAAVNLALAPFLLAFLLIYFFMKVGGGGAHRAWAQPGRLV